MAMKEAASRIPNPDPGTIGARLARVIEIGVQPTGKDNIYGYKDQVVLMYGLPTRIIDVEGDENDGRQYMVRSQPMRNSTSERASLYEHRAALDGGRTTRYGELLGLPCFVTIENNEVVKGSQKNTYTNIIGVSAVPEGMEVGELDRPQFYFDLDNPSEDIWVNDLWDNIREKITGSHEYSGSKVEEMVLRLAALSGD